MWKFLIFVTLCILSLGCAAFLAAWGPSSTIRDMYVVDRLDDPFLIILYAPLGFAVYAVLNWWRNDTRTSE